MDRGFGGPRMSPDLPYLEKPTGDRYILAGRITGKVKGENLDMSDKSADEDDRSSTWRVSSAVTGTRSTTP